jgi:hypothetical protein
MGLNRQLRHPSGPDAAAFMEWRGSMTDEQWIAWNAQDDDSWYRQVELEFGLDARPQPQVGASAAAVPVASRAS